MQIMDFFARQKQNKIKEATFKSNYRQKVKDTSKKHYLSSNFIAPSASPSKANLLGSSSTFRTLNNQRMANSSVKLRRGPKSEARSKFTPLKITERKGGTEMKQARAGSQMIMSEQKARRSNLIQR